jgi:hypothetical protein
MFRRLSAGLLTGLALAALLSQPACSENQYKAETWIKKLSDNRDSERAVQKLEELGDPKAIGPLGQLWESSGKPARILQVIIGLARPLSKEEAKDNIPEYEENGRPASWEAALPFLIKALAEVDESNPRSVDSAQKAADALGEAQAPAGLDALVELTSKPVTKKLIAAQVSAIRAIGMFTGEKAKAGAALTKIIDREPPPNPQSVKDGEQKRALEEKFTQFIGLSGAAINALGTLHASASTMVLIKAMYRTPALYAQIRRALVASGPGAVPELRKILRGEQKEINDLFAAGRLDKYCGDDGKTPTEQCQPVSLKDFYAATILGDFYDTSATPELLAALKRPALPFYYQDEQASPNTQYNAIFDALKKIGAADAAPDVKAIWSDAKASLGNRGMAINAYAFLTRDGAGTDELGKIAADNKADDNLRQAAAESFARLSSDPKQVGALQGLADKYLDASAKEKAKLATLQDAFNTAEADFKTAKKVLDEAEAKALKTTQDKGSSVDDIKKATEAGKVAKETFKAAKKKHTDAVAPYKQAEGMAKGYHQFARMFETHIARIEIAIRCKDDIACYAKTLSQKPDEVAAKVAPLIKDMGEWTAEEKKDLVPAQIERAMLELGKRGQKAQDQTELLLDSVKSDERLIRQSILLALPKIAKVPCESCQKKLLAAVKAGEGKTTLGDLNNETTILVNYFSWAGGKAPAAAEAPAAP